VLELPEIFSPVPTLIHPSVIFMPRSYWRMLKQAVQDAPYCNYTFVLVSASNHFLHFNIPVTTTPYALIVIIYLP